MSLIARPVLLQSGEHTRIIVTPMYHLLGYSDESRIFMQEEARDRLLVAVESLPAEYGVSVWDAYRSRECQGIMFEWMKEQVRQRHPLYSSDEIDTTAKKYMSAPSKVGDEYIPPHLSGGAIDLTLYDLRKKVEVQMGTSFDDCTERAHALYFETNDDLSEEDCEQRNARRILRGAMLSAGFTLYAYEWWHFDYGNVFWSASAERKQIFGPLFGDDDYPRSW